MNGSGNICHDLYIILHRGIVMFPVLLNSLHGKKLKYHFKRDSDRVSGNLRAENRKMKIIRSSSPHGNRPACPKN